MLIAYRPWPWPSDDDRWTPEQWFTLALALALLQLLPLPGLVLDFVSPHARDAWRRLVLDVPSAVPLSVDFGAGAWAWLVAFCTAVTFVSARHIFGRGGVRRVTRWVATIGLAVSALALAQEATSRGVMYWRWAPLDEGAPPFGPFVNRNHFGTWVILAVPLVLGYLAAHATAHARRSTPATSWQARLTQVLDARTIWLASAVVAMMVALVVSLSRSAMFGLMIALIAGGWLHRTVGTSRFRPGRWVAGVLLLAAVALLMRVDVPTIVARVGASPNSAAGRLMIWRDTLPVVRDFWLTGTGAGTYDTVMLVYQRARPGVRFNQAHNQYLQLAAEGGLLLAVPVLIGLYRLVREAGARLATDDSGMHFVRAGALCGLTGAAAQGLWETGLTTPANAILAAIVAAVAVHVPVRSGRSVDA